MTRAQLDKKPVDVASMFDTVADKYDVTNDVMTAGIDRVFGLPGGEVLSACPQNC